METELTIQQGSATATERRLMLEQHQHSLEQRMQELEQHMAALQQKIARMKELEAQPLESIIRRHTNYGP